MGQFWLPSLRVFVINDPEWVEKILILEPEKYPKHRLMHETLLPLTGASPFTTSGVVWSRQRRMLDQAFGHAGLSKVFPMMQQSCEDLLQRLKVLETEPEIDIEAAMTHVTADIIYRTIFSKPLDVSDAGKLFQAFAKFQQSSQRALVCKLFFIPTFWFNKRRSLHANYIRDFLSKSIVARCDYLSVEDELKGSDILAGLRTAVDQEDGSVLTTKELIDQVCMLFLAGHETSASSLSWCFYILSKEPDLQQRLRNEIQEIAHDRELQPNDVRQLKTLTALFREVLRLYPPVGYFPREATQDMEIRGSKVRKGDALLIFPWLLHRHRRWWDQPDVFNADRFTVARQSEQPKAVYLPFGLGARACIGAGFALQEAVLVLYSVLSNYKINSVAGFEPEVIGRLTVRAEPGIKVRLSAIDK